MPAPVAARGQIQKVQEEDGSLLVPLLEPRAAAHAAPVLHHILVPDRQEDHEHHGDAHEDGADDDERGVLHALDGLGSLLGDALALAHE